MENIVTAYFDLKKIDKSYQLVIADFDLINKTISCQRDKFDNVIAGNMLHAYNHINKRLALAPEKAILSSQEMLELNVIVHLGVDPEAREEYCGFIRHTEEKFVERIPFLMKWYDRHAQREDDPYKIAAGLYVRVLAEPQLFFDGNHRTGSLIANFYLLMKEKDPFVLTRDNAVEFFNLASDVKFKKEDIRSKFKRAIGWHDELARMRAFLEANAQPFTTDVMPEWTPQLQDHPESQSLSKMSRKKKAVGQQG